MGVIHYSAVIAAHVEIRRDKPRLMAEERFRSLAQRLQQSFRIGRLYSKRVDGRDRGARLIATSLR